MFTNISKLLPCPSFARAKQRLAILNLQSDIHALHIYIWKSFLVFWIRKFTFKNCRVFRAFSDKVIDPANFDIFIKCGFSGSSEATPFFQRYTEHLLSTQNLSSERLWVSARSPQSAVKSRKTTSKKRLSCFLWIVWHFKTNISKQFRNFLYS